MFASGQTVLQLMEQIAPKQLAFPDDKIGLQLGTVNKPIKRIMVALDITEAVAEEAVAAQVDLIIAHHALIFRPLTKIDTEEASGRLLQTLLKHDIAVYIAHTNLDIADGGVNDLLVAALGLSDVRVLSETEREPLFKLTVFVPHEDHEKVRIAMFAAGGGFISGISKYSHCSFNLHGRGTFLPLAGATPHIGEVGHLEEVAEARLEMVVGRRDVARVLDAMHAAHPYEEVAYDLVKLENQGAAFGLGRVGRIAEDRSTTLLCLEQFAGRVKQAYALPFVRVIGDLSTPIQHVAIIGGSGGRYFQQAKLAGADVLVTGDIDHHTALDALAAGICLIDAGHHIESIIKPALAAQLQDRLAQQSYQTEVFASRVSTDPFQYR